MDCDYAPTAEDRAVCYEASRAAAAERERKIREREARAAALREAATPAEAVQLAARMIRSVLASDWATLDGAALHNLGEAAAYLAVADRKLTAW